MNVKCNNTVARCDLYLLAKGSTYLKMAIKPIILINTELKCMDCKINTEIKLVQIGNCLSQLSFYPQNISQNSNGNVCLRIKGKNNS
jgi:hypothetical protein